jgi:transcriptional regulator with XRE-family HTH domain
MSHSLYTKDYCLFIQLLRQLRKSRGITQTQLAARLGKTQVYVSKCERCERRMDVIELVQFCEALGINPCLLMSQFLECRKNLPLDASESHRKSA